MTAVPVTARRIRTPAVAVVAACLAAALAVGGCSAAGTSAANSSPPTLAEVAALLARHGRAVLAHDDASFLADLDASRPAVTFRAAQQAEFANLTKVPLARWTYTIDAPADDSAAQAAATSAFGARAVIVHLRLSYALRGVDPVPTSHDLWWTFVRRAGHVVVAADDGLAAAGGTSWRGPWDFGPLVVVRGARSLVLGHPDHAALLPGIAAAVDAAVPAVTAVWGSNWPQQVAVIVPSTTAELAAETVEGSAVTADVAAAANVDGTDPVTGRAYGQRLLVNPAALGRLSAIGQQIVIRHEVTHIASADATSDASPRWLVEGFADYVANLGSGQPVTFAAGELRAAVHAGYLPTQLPPAAAFDAAGQAPIAYEAAWLACRLIASRIGAAGLVRFYTMVGAAVADPANAVPDELRALLHEDLAHFVAQWRAYLRALLG